MNDEANFPAGSLFPHPTVACCNRAAKRSLSSCRSTDQRTGACHLTAAGWPSGGQWSSMVRSMYAGCTQYVRSMYAVCPDHHARRDPPGGLDLVSPLSTTRRAAAVSIQRALEPKLASSPGLRTQGNDSGHCFLHRRHLIPNPQSFLRCARCVWSVPVPLSLSYAAGAGCTVQSTAQGWAYRAIADPGK
jgi:hypothetical protein